MTIRFALLGLAAALTGCSVTPRGTPPIWTGASRFDLNQTVSCVIKSLNVAMHSDSPLGMPITHQAGIIEPDRVMEVAPQQTFTAGFEFYYVRLSAISKSRTNIELFEHNATRWSERLRGGVAACAT
jgi:hypothetical protein